MAIKQRRYSSRLARSESKAMFKQSIVLMVLTVGVLIALVVWGVPAMVRVAGFLGDVKSSSQPINSNDSIAPFAPQLAVPFEATASAQIQVVSFAEAGASVTLFNNGNKVADSLVGSNGEVVFQQIDLVEGNNEFSASAKDPAGNESPLSTVKKVVFDQEAPKIDIKSPEMSDDRYKSDKKVLSVEGETEIGAKVLVNDRMFRVDGEGKFTGSLSLNDGENKFEFKVTDVAGNESKKEVVIEYYK